MFSNYMNKSYKKRMEVQQVATEGEMMQTFKSTAVM